MEELTVEQIKRLPWSSTDKWGGVSLKDGEMWFVSDKKEFIEESIAKTLADPEIQNDPNHPLNGATFQIVSR